MSMDSLSAALSDRYRIERELGAGGMATVYLAEDVRHGRKVAVKVLKPELSAVIGAERFVREIRTIAALQHPHILGLIDSGEVDGTAYYVMPFVEGESLRDRLTREKQLPVADAVRIATEVAGALDYAHRHGVIHRDIKPENILLHDGTALVADFGIALAVSNNAATRMTETGMSLGTPHYMSPEQAMGEREITARSDVYALGVIAYEMLTGEPPFTGPTAQAIIARVMTEEPRAITMQRRAVPPHVDAAVLTALEKLPADRFASAAEFAQALGDSAARTRRTTAARGAATRARLRLAWPTVAVLAAIAALWGWLRPRPGPVPGVPSILSIPTPGFGGASTGLLRQIAISPDGSTLLYTAFHEGRTQTMRRALASDSAVPVPGLPPFLTGYSISPDGREFIGSVFATRASYRFPIDGGNGQPLPAEVTLPTEMLWEADGSLVLDDTWEGGRAILRLRPSGELVKAVEATGGATSPAVLLPGGRFALGVQRPSGAATGPVVILDLETGAVQSLLNIAAVQVRYSAGYLLYALTNGSLDAVPFDARKREVTGAAVTIATGVSLTGSGFAQFDASTNGTVVYVPEEPRSLVEVSRAGAVRSVTEARHNFHSPRYAPDGRRIAVDFTTVDGRDVWLVDRRDGSLTRATFARDGHDATWSPDGRSLIYVSAPAGVLGVHRTTPGRAEAAESLLTSRQVGTTGTWLRDGSGIVTVANGAADASGSDIAVVTNGGRGPITPLVATRFSESYPALSPDGRWLAFVSNLSGRDEVFIRPFSGGDAQVQVSLDGGSEPMWAPNGHELYFRSGELGNPELIAAQLSLAGDPTVTGRRALFPLTDFAGATPHANYDVSPDGNSFAMVRFNPSSRIVVIQNLPALVERLRRARSGPDE